MPIGMGREAVILDWNISFNVTIYLTLATRRKRINVVVTCTLVECHINVGFESLLIFSL